MLNLATLISNEKFDLDKFGKSQFPSKKNGKWVIANQFKSSNVKNLSDYIELLVQNIMNESENLIDKAPKNLENFIQKVNVKWIETRGYSFKFDENSKQILFNSKDKDYFWLSNFFPTLIICEDLKMILNSVEKGYKLLKLKLANEKNIVNEEGLFEKIVKTEDLLKLKKIKIKLGDENCDNEINKIMLNLIHLKFAQNPTLKRWLISTGCAELVENTSNTYWGIGPREIDKDGDGKNVLGKILDAERDSIKNIKNESNN